MKLGSYAYRFSGHAMDEGYSHYLIGVGTLILSKNSEIEGHQRTSITRLRGRGSKLVVGYWSLSGRYLLEPNPYGPTDYRSDITFQQLNHPDSAKNQKLDGSFSFVPVNNEKIWIIATGGTIMSPQSSRGKLANEAISGEAVFIGS